MLHVSAALNANASADLITQSGHIQAGHVTEYPVTPSMGHTHGMTPLHHYDRKPVEPNRLCRIAFLDAAAVDAVKANHDVVLEGLPPEFMYPKSREFFLDHLACNPSNTIVGVIDGQTLAAKSTITCYSSDKPYYWNEGYTPVMRNEDICVIGGVTVLPEYRGNDFMRSMVQAWKKHALNNDKEWLLAEIDMRNVHSLENFLVEGIHVVGIATDKSDGGHNHIVARRTDAANAENILADPERAVTVCVTDIDMQKYLLEEGYVGVGCDLKARTITYTPAI